jgi:exportin-5
MEFSHRTKNLDSETRRQRLGNYIIPVKQSWVDPGLTESLQSFQGFCRLLGLDRVQEYLVSRRVNEIQDFSQHTLDAEGQALQNELTEKFKVSIFVVRKNKPAYAAS